MTALPIDEHPSRLPEPPPESVIYDDRAEAGRKLAGMLARYRRRKSLLVLAISVEGVEVALPIAQALQSPLDLIVSSLLPTPGRPESSFGAVADSTVVVNDGLVAGWGLNPAEVEHIVRDTQDKDRHRMRRLRGERPLPELRGKTVIFADDGMAVGFPIVAAVEWARKQKCRDIVVGLPVAPRYEIDRLNPLVSEVVCPVQKDTWKLSVAAFYRRWQKPTDNRIAALLRQASIMPAKG